MTLDKLALRVLEVNSRPPSLHQTHKFSDHRNKNWPIRNSFFRGKACKCVELFVGIICNFIFNRSTQFSDTRRSTRRRLWVRIWRILVFFFFIHCFFHSTIFRERSAKVSIEGSFLIATGSAEPYAYIFDIGNPKGGLLQKLRGHQNRVYSASFHPFNPILATSSADSTIKLWSCGRF